MTKTKGSLGYIKSFGVGDRVRIVRGDSYGLEGEVIETWPARKRAMVYVPDTNPTAAFPRTFDVILGYGSLKKIRG